MGIEMHSQHHPDPDGLGHSSPCVVQYTTVRNTCCLHPFLPFAFCPVRHSASPVS